MNPDDSDDTIAPIDATAPTTPADDTDTDTDATAPVAVPDSDDDTDADADSAALTEATSTPASTSDEAETPALSPASSSASFPAPSDVSDPSEPAVVSAPVVSAPAVSALAPSVVAPPTSTPAPNDLRPASDAFLQSIRPLSAIAREQREHAHIEELMAFATKKGSVTREDARLLLRISRSTATHYLSVLVQQGRLVMTGPKSETVYKVVVNLN